VRLRSEDPVAHVHVELALRRGLGGCGPVGDVLAIAADRQSRRVTPPGMCTVGGFDHGEDAMAGHAHAVPESLEVVHDALHRGDDAAPGGPGAPDPVEQRFGEHQIAGGVGGRGMDQGDVGRERLEQSERAERRVDDGERVVLRHGRRAERPGDRGRQTARRCLEPLGQREDRPVLHLDGAGLVGFAEHGVRRVGRKAVARVRGHHLADEAALEEGGAERTQAGHHEGEAGVAPPELPGQFPRRRRPTAVSHHHQHRVAGPDRLPDGLVEGGERRTDRRRGRGRHRARGT
jgi:hypothetical protein